MSKLNYFTNDNFRIVNYLYDHKNEAGIVSITQQELANQLGLSRITINKLMNDMIERGYLLRIETTVGRYALNKEMIDFVKGVRNSDNKK